MQVVSTFAKVICAICVVSACIEAEAAERQYDTEPSGSYSDQALDELARKFQISAEVHELHSLVTDDNRSLRLAWFQNKVNKRLALVFFECNEAIADVTAELNDIRSRRDNLESKRNARVTKTNTLNFLTRGAISIPASAYSIPPAQLPTNGNIMNVTANGISTLLSVVALAQSRGGRDSNGKASILTSIFFGQGETCFQPYVWDYLNSQPIDKSSSATHIETLRSAWIKGKLAPDPGSKSGKRRLQELLETDGVLVGLNIESLKNREVMLLGLRTTLMQMSKGLNRLAASI